MEFGLNCPSGFRECFKMLTDDGRTIRVLLNYKLTYEPKGSGELKYDLANFSSATYI